MLSIKKFFQKLTTSGQKQEATPTQVALGDQKQSNFFTEIKLLLAHNDIVRVILKLDWHRFVSAGDDGNILMWTNEGEKLTTFAGHTRGITCLLALSPTILISGSADRTIKFWDVNSGECLQTLTKHNSSVKCLAKLDKDSFCSAGNDRFIYIWSNDGTYQGTIERQEEENLNCLLVISEQRLVTAGSNSHMLLVYSLNTKSCVKLLSYHRESVRCLVNISKDSFASGALDGSVLIWQTMELQCMYRLNFPDSFISTDRVFVFSVNSLLKLDETRLIACLGNSFRMYDTSTGDLLAECPNAHSSQIMAVTAVYSNSVLVTSAADGSVRLWLVKVLTEKSANNRAFSRNKDNLAASGERRAKKYAIEPIGEMFCHSDQVNCLIPLLPHTFVTASYDGSVIIWMDGRVESDRRSEDALSSLMNFKAMLSAEQTLGDEYESESDDSRQQSANAETTDSSNLSPSDSNMEEAKSPGFGEDKQPASSTFRVFGSSRVTNRESDEGSSLYAIAPAPLSLMRGAGTRSGDSEENLLGISAAALKNVRVPQTLLDYATMLHKEESQPLSKIAEILKQEGNSDTMVAATIQHLSDNSR